MPFLGGPFLIATGRADRTIHVEHFIVHPVAIMKPVNPLPVLIGQRCPVLLGQGQRLGFKPRLLGSRGRPRSGDDGIEGQPVYIVEILVSGQQPV